MKMKISKKNIIYIFLILNPIVEIIYSFTMGFGKDAGLSRNGATINRVIRMLIMILMILDIKDKRNFIKIAGFSAVLFLSYIYIVCFGFQIRIGTDISFLLKIILGITVYYYFYEGFKLNRFTVEDISKALVIAMWIVSIGILLSYFGIGYSSYGSSRRGYRGLFMAVNMPTAYILMSLPLSWLYAHRYRWIEMIIGGLALVTLGTKTGIFGLVLLFLMLGIYSLVKAILERKIKLVVVFILLIGSMGMILAFILIINKYIPYLKELFLNNSYYHGSIYSFLVSNRDTQIELADRYFDSLNGLTKVIAILFGVGYSRIEKELVSVYRNYFTVEQDFHCIYYCCGIIAISFILFIVLRTLKHSISNLRKINDSRNFYLFLAISIGIIHAFLGGHVLTESMCIFPFYIILAIINYNYSKNIYHQKEMNCIR